MSRSVRCRLAWVVTPAGPGRRSVYHPRTRGRGPGRARRPRRPDTPPARLVHGAVLDSSGGCTYTNPVRTTSNAALYTALQKPILEPLCHLMVWSSPLVRLMNWLSYLNGSAHRSTERDSFSGKETRGPLDFITRYYRKAAPDVLARGMLAMFRSDATDVLGLLRVPTLVVAGDQDGTCRPEASRHMAGAIPGATLVTLAPGQAPGAVRAPRPVPHGHQGVPGRRCVGSAAARPCRGNGPRRPPLTRRPGRGSCFRDGV